MRELHIETPFPNGESYRQVVDRMRDFVTDVVREWSGASVVLIGHSATRWSLEHLLLGNRLEDLVAENVEWQPGWRYLVAQSSDFCKYTA